MARWMDGKVDCWCSLEVVKHSGTNNQLSAPPALFPVSNHFSSPLLRPTSPPPSLPPSSFSSLFPFSPVSVRGRFPLFPLLLAGSG